MRVADLVGMTDLKLEPLTGADGLDRVIRWVYTTDLLDPGRYLTGGELVLTGLMWRRTPEDSAAFVRTAAARHVACIAAGDAAYGEVPEDLVLACRDHGVPLLEVPVDVSFATITERAIRQLTVERQGDLDEQLRRRRTLLAAVAEGAGLDELLALWERDAEVGCSLLTAIGRAPVPSASTLPAECGDTLAERFLTARSFPDVVQDGCGRQTYSLFPVGTSDQRRIAGWFLACEGDHRDWSRGMHESVSELASLIALERERLAESGRVEQVAVEQLVRLVLSGRAEGEEISGRLEALGFAGGSYVVVSAALDPRPDGQLVRDVLDELLAALASGERKSVVTALDDEAVAIVSAGDGIDADAVRSVAQRLSGAVGERRVLLGLSLRAMGAHRLGAAVHEARQARLLAALRPGRVAVLGTGEIDSHALLLAAVPDDVRQTFRSRVLGPVLDYDERHGSDLVFTLAAFLDASGSWAQCAKRLHVHVNTLRYRIQRVEELTGRSLATLEDRVDYFLALRIGERGTRG